MAWANGRGTTLEVATFPTADNWTWRVSIARVEVDGAFSSLAGVDRALVVASGAGMHLQIGDRHHTIGRFESIQFSGDEPTEATLPSGPVDDVNLMVRRGQGIGLPRWHVEHLQRGDTVVLGEAVAAVILDGVVTLSTPDGSFPFTPKHLRATRFDALLRSPFEADELTSASVTRDAVLAFAILDERS